MPECWAAATHLAVHNCSTSNLLYPLNHTRVHTQHTLTHSQVRMKDAQSGRMVDDYWEASKVMLQDADFLGSLRAYDKDHIDVNIIKKIKVRWRAVGELRGCGCVFMRGLQASGKGWLSHSLQPCCQFRWGCGGHV